MSREPRRRAIPKGVPGGGEPRLPQSIRRAALTVARHWPFTLSGTLLLGASAALIYVGFTHTNIYTLLLGLLAFAVLAILAILGSVQAARFRRVAVRWDTSQTLVARRKRIGDRVIVERVRAFLFFRLHAVVRARLEVGHGATLSIARESATVGGGEARVELDLPLAGTLRSRGTTAVRDVFGLTRSRFGEPHITVRPVLPAGIGELEKLPISATGGNEEQNRKAQVEEEKYFQREYLPGDRARDINWKASSRLAQLITRISPYTQEKSKVIRIVIRAYRKPRPESLDSVMHLNRMKSRVVSFLRAVKSEHPEYSFEIACGDSHWSVDSDDQIESFARDLAGVLYRGDAHEVGPSAAAAAGQLVIFTTPFDEGLAASLSVYAKSVLHVITTATPDPRRRGEAEMEPLFETDPGSPRIDLPLPGGWALRRERPRSRLGKTLPAGAGVGGTVTEEPIAVSLIGVP